MGVDFWRGSDRDRFDPDSYIRTKSGSCLAFVKILEAITAGAGIIMMVFVSDFVSRIIIELADLIGELLKFTLPQTLAALLNGLLRYSLVLPVLILVLILLDGIGVFMMRCSGSGEGLVRFVHRMYWLGYLAEIILLIIGVIRYISSLNQIRTALSDSGSSSAAANLSLAGILVYPLFLSAFLILLFYCNYHHDICTVLKAVHEERLHRRPAEVGKNHLMGRTGWFTWAFGLDFGFYAFCCVYPLFTHRNVLPDGVVISLPGVPMMVMIRIWTLFFGLGFLKYLSLRRCVRNFYRIRK